MKCNHFWYYENSTPHETGKKNIVVIRRWCGKCGLVQITETTGKWINQKLGEDVIYGDRPDDYPEEFVKRNTKL
jgi:hypothetical protein